MKKAMVLAMAMVLVAGVAMAAEPYIVCNHTRVV